MWHNGYMHKGTGYDIYMQYDNYAVLVPQNDSFHAYVWNVRTGWKRRFSGETAHWDADRLAMDKAMEERHGAR